MAKLVNVKKESYHVYIGRPSIYGNPFRIGRDGDRTEVVQKYRTWFTNRLQDPRFILQLESLRGKSLGCHCHPLPCHGDVIIEYLNGKSS